MLSKSMEVLRFLAVFTGYTGFIAALIPLINAASSSWVSDLPWIPQIALLVTLLVVPMPSPICTVLAATIVSISEESKLAAWQLFLDNVPLFWRFAVMIPLLCTATFWINSGVMLTVDYFGYPEQLKKYKIQKERIEGEAMSKLLTRTAFNTIVLVPLIGVACYYIHMSTPAKIDFDRSRVPNPLEMALHFVFYILVNEHVFFYGHWLFHASPFLYKHIHKIHHEYKAPNGLAALYCHPIELVVSDFLPLGAGAFLLRSHGMTFFLWCVYAVLGTMTHHSGYRWPWVIPVDHQPNYHDFHHKAFNTNYGNLGFMDKLHGTEGPWIALQERSKTLKEKVEKGEEGAEEAMKLLQNQFVE